MLPRPLIIASLLGASVGVPYIASQTRQSLAGSPNAAAATRAAVTQPQPSYIPPPTSAYSTNSMLPQSSLVAPPLASPPPATTVAPVTSFTAAPSIGAQPVGTQPAGPQSVTAQPISTSTIAAPQPVVSAAPATVIPAYPTTATPQDGARFNSVDEVLRFDITREWVLRNWPRTSTGPTDVGLLAMRVPLVMGTQMSSLVGSLTYFFNAQGQVEHISFRGRTGDARPLEQLLTQRYQFQPFASATGEKVFQVRSGDAIFSELRLRPDAVIRSNTPQQSIVVELEFARPGTQRVLPPHEPTLQLPPGTPPAQPPAEKAADAANGNQASGGYWDRVHYATPAEERQLQRLRWPQ